MQEEKLKLLFGNKIKKLREQAGFTQEEFGNLIMLEQPNLSNIETGKSLPSFLTFISMVEVLKVNPNSMLDFLGEYEDVELEDKVDSEILKHFLSLSIKTKHMLAEVMKKFD